MSKRLISTDKRAETIIANLKDDNFNLSSYASNSIIDEALPVYSQLRVEAIYLLDLITDNAKEWTGNKLVTTVSENEIQNYTRQGLSRGVSWLQHNHHIKNCIVLRDIVQFYNTSSWNGGIALDQLNSNVQEMIKIIIQRLKAIDHKYNDFYVGLGSLARDVLDHWDKLWDCDDAYIILNMTFSLEHTIKPIEPFFAIRALQAMENQFILEAIGEKQ